MELTDHKMAQYIQYIFLLNSPIFVFDLMFSSVNHTKMETESLNLSLKKGIIQ